MRLICKEMICKLKKKKNGDKLRKSENNVLMSQWQKLQSYAIHEKS